MEWQYLEKDPPKREGPYLIYTLSGKMSVNNYRHLAKGRRNDGSEYICFYSGTYGDEDIGFHFTKQTCCEPLKDVVIYAEIPPIPDDLDKKNALIRKYREQIRELNSKIKALNQK